MTGLTTYSLSGSAGVLGVTLPSAELMTPFGLWIRCLVSWVSCIQQRQEDHTVSDLTSHKMRCGTADLLYCAGNWGWRVRLLFTGSVAHQPVSLLHSSPPCPWVTELLQGGLALPRSSQRFQKPLLPWQTFSAIACPALPILSTVHSWSLSGISHPISHKVGHENKHTYCMLVYISCTDPAGATGKTLRKLFLKQWATF